MDPNRPDSTAAAERLLHSRQPPVPAIPGIDTKRLWRAHVTAADWRGMEVTAFADALNANAAVRKIAAVIAVLESRKAEEVAERLYNCYSAVELIADGLSDDPALRLFETGWSGGRAICWVGQPLVLTASPGTLLAIWARIPPEVPR